MKKITCESCGGNSFKIKGNTYECEFCGSKYSVADDSTILDKSLTDAKIVQCYLEANNFQKKNDFSSELNVLIGALELDPNNPVTLVKIGRCYRNLHLHAEAIKMYKKAIEIDEETGSAYTNIGTISILNKNWSEAAAYYKKGLPYIDKNTSDYWIGYANYAIAVAQLGDQATAEKMIAEAEAHGYKNGDGCREMAGISKQGCNGAPCVPNTDHRTGADKTLTDAKIIQYYLEAEKFQAKNDFANELKVLTGALELDPNNPDTLVKLGRCYRNLHLHAEAIKMYQKAIEIDEGTGTAYTNLGTIAILNKNWTEAAAYYKKGLPYIDKNTSDYWTAYANYAIAVAQMGDKATAKKMITEAEAHGYKNGDGCRKMAGISKQGCYVATCVYGTYDCPQVWTLRRYRDNTLSASWYGRAFIRVYYAISPRIVKCFGNTQWFQNLWKRKLDQMVSKLRANGIEDTPYQDKEWR